LASDETGWCIHQVHLPTFPAKRQSRGLPGLSKNH
jgi:hypothetical protein